MNPEHSSLFHGATEITQQPHDLPEWSAGERGYPTSVDPGAAQVVRIVMTIRNDNLAVRNGSGATTSIVLDVALPGDAGMSLVDRVHRLLPAARVVRVARHPGAELAPVSRDIADRRSDSTRRLTSRETEVLNLISQGLLNKEIAARLAITTETVRAHLKRIYTKLGVHTRTEAAVKHLRMEPLAQSA
jgi:DNA-binding CsgD family transcriptional regulator